MGSKTLMSAKSSLRKLRGVMARYHAGWKAGGGKLTSWYCGHCKKRNTCRRPKPSDVDRKGYWDATTICTHCGGLSFVCVYPNGAAPARKMDEFPLRPLR